MIFSRLTRSEMNTSKYFTAGIFLLSMCIFIPVSAQIKSIGVPMVQNYSTQITQAGPQTWDIYEDTKGNIYFGNERGVVTFDGQEWQLIPLENNSEVYSIAQASDGNIYVGGYTEIGYISRDTTGNTVYRSLNHLIPEAYRNFSSVWKIYQTHLGIIFQSYEYIFILKEESINVIESSSSFGFSYYVNNTFYIVEKEEGLKMLNNGELLTVSDAPLFSEDEIRIILPFRSQELLIGSFSNGFYILSDEGLKKWDVSMNAAAIDNNLYSGSFNEGHYLFGTVKNGLYVTDINGNIIQNINRMKGLQNNTVLSHYVDTRGNLWLGLDNGLDYLKASLPISIMNHNFNLEAVYTSIVYDDMLYVGTNQGLFSKPLDAISDPSEIEFEMVKNSEGQVWQLAVHDDQLLCAHNYGAFRIEGTEAFRISASDGVWNFFTMNGIEDRLFSGSYYGFVVYDKDINGNWFQTGSIDVGKSLRKIICDQDNTIWVSHDHEGIFRITLNDDYSALASFEAYLDTLGLSGDLPYHLHLRNGLFFVSTSDGYLTYNSEQNIFSPSAELNALFSDHGKMSFFLVDQSGNQWYAAEEGIGYYRLMNDGTYRDITTPFAQFTSYFKENYEHIYVYDYKNVFIGSLNGLIHFDPTIDKNFSYPINAYIKKVEIASRNADSVLFHKGNKSMVTEHAFETYKLGHNWNNISFEFNCPDTESAGNISFSYRLMGRSDQWSDWTRQTSASFNNLKIGSYVFEIRARNVYGNISETDRFAFSIAKPYYRSTVAYIIYILLISGVTILAIVNLRKRFETIRTEEEQKHTAAFQKKEEQLKEEQLRAEREIERLRIDNLETSMKHKNKELVNSTYHIIRKNKFLNALKQELSNLSQMAKSEVVERELKKISRKIDRDINNEKNWEVFDRYFDEVHQEFLSRLKDQHPDLSPKELRLSAYLRMNISTKEIAPLMNISIRGVEISRYRLRKKLDLDRDTNLTQYLMEV